MPNMTPSTKTDGMSDGQIDKAADALRSAFAAKLRAHRVEFRVVATQQALGAKGLIPDMFAVFRRYVELFDNLIVRLVYPDRNRTPMAVLDATGRKQYTNESVVAGMPRGTGEEAKVVFFKLGHFISDIDLDKEYESRGFKPADPFSLAAVNEADPAFADEHPNATQWKDADGKWCYAAFFLWLDERRVLVRRHDYVWHGFWWFAGLAS